jgi:hypothetical protein
MLDYYWDLNNNYGLQYRADLALLRNTVARGELSRKLQLSNMGVEVAADEGLTGAYALRFAFKGSKTNQYGKVEQAGMLRYVFLIYSRSKDVKACGVGAIAFMLFSRSHILEDVWPTFDSQANWYNIYLFRSAKDGKKAVSYKSQYDSLVKARDVL